MPDISQLITAYSGEGAETVRPEERPSLIEPLNDVFKDGAVYPSSLCQLPGALLAVLDQKDDEVLLVLSPVGQPPAWLTRFKGSALETHGLSVLMAEPSPNNIQALQEMVPYTQPQILGLTPSFGFGDRIGLATPGHVQALSLSGGHIAPIFAQQSIRELNRTERTSRQVMDSAVWGVFRGGWTLPWGADGDHLKAKEDIEEVAEAGFVFFTIDPSEHVDQQADDYSLGQIEERFNALLVEKVSGAAEMIPLYKGENYFLSSASDKVKVTFEEPLLKRAAVKYSRALAFIYDINAHIAKTMGGKAYELEISVDETEQPTTLLEHLFLVLELKRHEVQFVSLAPRYIGDFEKGIDYKGDILAFGKSLQEHAAVAKQYGPYKLSLHSGSDKFSIYPAFARYAPDLFHIKTAGTSYLEALRVVGRADRPLFRSIIAFARSCFQTDRATYHISAGLDLVPEPDRLAPEELLPVYLDQDHGRQILHVTFGSVLTAREGGNYLFRDKILGILRQHRSLHDEMLQTHMGKHIRLLL